MSKSVDVSDIELDNKTIQKIMNDIDIDHTFTEYEVVIYANEAKITKNECVIKPDRILHAVIIFLTSKGNEFTFEWGNWTDNSIPPDVEENIPYYRYEKQSWFGCKIQGGKIKIKLSEILYHAKQWKEKFGKGGTYPKNCRGYVDSVLEFIGEERAWKK